MTELIRTLILGVVEGITEFLPVSSTGHLLLAQHAMGMPEADPFWKTFTVFIQIGAIFAVVVYFRHRILNLLRGEQARARGDAAMTPLEAAMAQRARSAVGAAVNSSAAAGAGPTNGDPSAAPSEYERPARPRVSPILLVIAGTIPVLAAGFLTHKWVETHLEGSKPVALALGIGGVIMILIEMFCPAPTTPKVENMSLGQAIGIGLTQILAAVFPGTSRSAATILPGMLMGLSREAAAEFSFFLAIPAMFAACGYSLLKELHKHGMDAQHWMLMFIGTGVSFLVAWVVIAAFMSFIRKNSFIGFGIYRIIIAVVVYFWMVRGK